MPTQKTEITIDNWPEVSSSYNKISTDKYEELEESLILTDEFDDILNTIFDPIEVSKYLSIVKYFIVPSRLNRFTSEEKDILFSRKESLEELYEELNVNWKIDEIIL